MKKIFIIKAGKYKLFNLSRKIDLSEELLLIKLPFIKKKLIEIGIGNDSGYHGIFASAIAKFITKYTNETVSFVCIFDNDELIGKGLPSYCVIEWRDKYWDIDGILTEEELLKVSITIQHEEIIVQSETDIESISLFKAIYDSKTAQIIEGIIYAVFNDWDLEFGFVKGEPTIISEEKIMRKIFPYKYISGNGRQLRMPCEDPNPPRKGTMRFAIVEVLRLSIPNIIKTLDNKYNYIHKLNRSIEGRKKPPLNTGRVKREIEAMKDSFSTVATEYMFSDEFIAIMKLIDSRVDKIEIEITKYIKRR
jgi:hypothetical protein